MEYYWVIKINVVLIHDTTWMNVENTMLSDKRQSQKATYCINPFIWNVQNRQIYGEGKLEFSDGGTTPLNCIFSLNLYAFLPYLSIWDYLMDNLDKSTKYGVRVLGQALLFTNCVTSSSNFSFLFIANGNNNAFHLLYIRKLKWKYNFHDNIMLRLCNFF